MTTSIMVYLRYPRSDEFGFHCKRMAMLSNANLFEVACQPSIQLFQYIRTAPFNRLTWYPENLVLVKGRGANPVPEVVRHPPATHDLSAKTIADVSEAIIGAALLSAKGEKNRFDAALKAVTKLIDSEDHNVSKWCELQELYAAPAWEQISDDPIAIDLSDRVYETTGYQFQHPRLLRSAFTHPSDTVSPVPDYQRLEFIGDAILDMVG